MRPALREDLRAAGRGAAAGILAGVVFGVAHGVFLVWVAPPFLAGALAGSVAGGLCGIALRRAQRPVAPWRSGLLLSAPALPLGVAAFLVAPVVGSPSWLAAGALAACVAAGAVAGRRLRAGWWGVGALAFVGLVVGGPGEPFVHEGPEPRIVGFYGGLVLALAVAGASAALLARGAAPLRTVREGRPS